MASNNNESKKSCETITLILKEERFEVKKQKLIDNSKYFAALLSVNYVEYEQTEHVINYDISSIALQDFIDWIHNDKIAFLSDCEKNYDFEDFDRTVILLELSVLLATDNLIEIISDKLERHFMLPNNAIKIWLLAQEFNINVLRDLALAVCLDRFEELPLDKIYELSRENFLKLIGNNNLNSTKLYFLCVIRGWMDHHNDATIPSYKSLNKKEPKILQSVISCEHNNHEQFVHCWDGNDFFELISFEYPANIIEHHCNTGRCLEGMQITGRRYDLYLCGGEYGIGSGRFNKNVWRYSLISKKWILETIMPVERRHMITVFLKHKLLLIGGVGRYRQKLQTVDIYDICTGMWTSGARVPLQFTSVPEYVIFNDKLMVHECKCVHIYFPDEDIWETKFDYENSISTKVPVLTLQTTSCYIDSCGEDKMVLRTIRETCNTEGCTNVIATLPIMTSTKNEVRPLCYVLGTKCNAYFFFLTPFHNYRIVAMLVTDREKHDLKMECLHSIPIQNPRKFRSLTFTKNSFTKFFQLFHPGYLHWGYI